jgi:hypothetical protein
MAMLRFGDVALDVDRALLRDRNGTEIALRPKSLDLLLTLACAQATLGSNHAQCFAVLVAAFTDAERRVRPVPTHLPTQGRIRHWRMRERPRVSLLLLVGGSLVQIKSVITDAS